MKSYEELKPLIDQAIREKHAELAALSDDLADHPETALQEYETSKKIAALLEKEGFAVEHPFAGYDTAFRGVYGDNRHRYKIALLTEYDALPDIGHACGHNLSGAISILAGLALKDLQDALDADIHIIGTPAEEDAGAKCRMSDEGIFKAYDMAMMVHLYDQNLIYCKLNGLASIMYQFHGKASHAGAMPWGGQNALNAAQLMMQAEKL